MTRQPVYVVKGARILGAEQADLVLEGGAIVEVGSDLKRSGANGSGR